MSHRVHRFDIKMTRDQTRLGQFLNSLKGEVIAILPNVTGFSGYSEVNFLLIVERVE